MARTPPPLRTVKGRGAGLNPAGRYERLATEAVSDGWDSGWEAPVLRTEVVEERPRKIITRNSSPDISFDRSINPYRGCEHGCVYCFARQSHAFLGLSPGQDFESRLTVKPGAAEALRRELSSRSYTPDVLAIGTNTDPYQPIERDWQVMRACLGVLSAFRHPVEITTKGTLVERDIDILAEMAQQRLAQVGISVTSLDAALSRRLEPRVPPPKRRLQSVERLAAAGVPVRVSISPIIPGLTDHEIESLLQSARDAGATTASMILLRMPREVAPLMRDWLATHVPQRAERVLARVRETQGGRDYDARFGHRMKGQGIYAKLLYQRFQLALRRTGLAPALPPLRCDLFRRPIEQGDQLSLF